jgi:hypothetical protein
MPTYPQYRVFPAADKAPALTNETAAEIVGEVRNPGGYHYASDDFKIRDAMFAAAPGAAIGVPMAINGLVALDYDPRNDQDGSGMAWLEEHNAMLSKTRSHKTKSNGLHIIFKAPDGVRFPATVPGLKSIDIKHNGYIIWPPSAGYEVLYDVSPTRMPMALVDLLQAREHIDIKRDELGEHEKGMLAGLDAILSESNTSLISQISTRRNTLSGYDEWTRLVGAYANTFKGSPHEQSAKDAVLAFSLRWEEGRADPESIRREFEASWKSYGSMQRAGGVGAATAQQVVSKLPVIPPKSVEIEDEEVDELDPSTIPARQWMLGRHYIRGYVTSTVAPGGTGKSSLALIEGMSIALDTPFLGQETYEDAPKVLYWSGEDDTQERRRRMASACALHDVDPKALHNRLFTLGPDELPIRLARMDNGDAIIDDKTIALLEDLLVKNDIAVLIVDPFAKTHSVNENSNDHVNLVIYTLSQIAQRTNTAIELVHHTTKEYRSNNGDSGVSGARGASALVDACRSVRTLRPMTKDEAKEYGISDDDRSSYIRVESGKANLAKKSHGWWFQLETYDLGNASGRRPSDTVGVVMPWDRPALRVSDQFFSEHSFAILTTLAQQGEPDADHMRDDLRANGWAGYTLAAMVRVDVGTAGTKKSEITPEQATNRHGIQGLLDRFVQEGVLRLTEVKSPRGRPVRVYGVNIAALNRVKEAMEAA